MMKNRIKIVSAFVAFFLILNINSLFSQQGNSTIDNLVQKLQQKVLLSDEQVKNVRIILITYSENKTDDELNRAQKKVEALLDEKQKMKYQVIKNDWWKEVKKQIT